PKVFLGPVTRPAADEEAIADVVAAIATAQRPILLTGSGVLWSDATDELQKFVEATGIPVYSTPQGRGVIPEDHPYFYGHARGQAYKQADLVIVMGTRLNYIFSQGKP